MSWKKVDVTDLILRDDLPSEDRTRLTLYYRHSHALMLFLLLRDEGGEFLEQLRAIASMTPDELNQLEEEWIAWCRNLSEG